VLPALTHIAGLKTAAVKGNEESGEPRAEHGRAGRISESGRPAAR